MSALRAYLWDYYGQGNEVRAGGKIPPEERLEKPEALARFEQARDLGVPYVTGGLQDQPFWWVQEHGVVKQFLEEWETIERIQAAQAQK
jgi:hypothetical protein